MINRAGFRRSTRVPMAGASARETKSTGTNHARPSRTGAAGSEISRPPTEASAWPGAEHDRLRLRCHREPARCDIFAKREIEDACQVVEGEHLLTADRSYGERPTAVAGHDGVGGGALSRRLSLLCLGPQITRKTARRQSTEGGQ